MIVPVSAVIIDHSITRLPLIVDAIYSIQKNTYLPSEILVVLDVDEEEFFCYKKNIFSYKFLDFSYIRILRNLRAKGPAGARNFGISQSRYEWIAFLDSDDVWHRKKLESQWNFMRRRPHLKASHTKELWYKNNRIVVTPKRLEPGTGRFLVEAFRNCLVSMSSLVIHKQVFKEIGGFDEDLPAAEDYDFWLRFLVHYPIALVPDIHAKPPTLKRSGGWVQTSQTKNMDIYRLYSLLKIYEIYYHLLSSREKKELFHQIRYRFSIVQQQKSKYEFSPVAEKIYLKSLEKLDNLDF